MGRLAIIEDDSATSVAAAASNKTSSDKSETKTKSSSAAEAIPAATASGIAGGSGHKYGPATSSMTDGSSATNNSTKRSCNKKLQGGVSDESGYYEDDELQGDDSIEIVYDRISDRNNRIIQQQQQNVAAAAMKNTHQLVSSTTTSAVSITPIPVSGLSSVHQPTSSSNFAQGRKNNQPNMYLVLLRGSGSQNLGNPGKYWRSGILNLENPNPKIFGNPLALLKIYFWFLSKNSSPFVYVDIDKL